VIRKAYFQNRVDSLQKNLLEPSYSKAVCKAKEGRTEDDPCELEVWISEEEGVYHQTPHAIAV